MFVHGRKSGCRITLDYTYRGLPVAYLENDALAVGVLTGKGGDIIELTYKPRDVDFLWHSPIEPRSPFVSTVPQAEGAFHDYYFGGWQEVLPSAGWSDEPYQGAQQGLHGELALLPLNARVLEDSAGEVVLELSTRLYRSPLSLVRRMSLRDNVPALFIDETLRNEADQEFAVMWGHHPAVGAPFLDESCVVSAPASRVDVLDFHPNGLWERGEGFAYPLVPSRRSGEPEDIRRVRPPGTRSADVLRLTGLAAGWYGLTSQRLGVGLGMAWDAQVFPELWMWQGYRGHDDYPWFGRAYNLALEPHTSWPPSGVANAARNGTARVLGPGEVVETSLVAVGYEAESISAVHPDGSVEKGS